MDFSHFFDIFFMGCFPKNEAGQSKILRSVDYFYIVLHNIKITLTYLYREVDEQCAKEGLSYSDKLKRFAKALDQSREVREGFKKELRLLAQPHLESFKSIRNNVKKVGHLDPLWTP